MIKSRCRRVTRAMADSNTAPLCNDCRDRVAEIFQVNGEYCNMYIDKSHYYYRLCSCVECCLSSSLELKVLLQKSHEKLTETPGVDSSDLLPPPPPPPPLAATPEPCISS